VATTNAEAKITADDWMPVYYLPWVPNATVRTTLRPRSQTTRAGLQGTASDSGQQQVPGGSE